jgi:hypothetical protein
MVATTVGPRERAMGSGPLQSETTLGEQTLVPGVRPVSVGERLQAVMNGPLLPKRPQKPCKSRALRRRRPQSARSLHSREADSLALLVRRDQALLGEKGRADSRGDVVNIRSV